MVDPSSVQTIGRVVLDAEPFNSSQRAEIRWQEIGNSNFPCKSYYLIRGDRKLWET